MFRFLYVGNRGHNSIAVFKTDPDSGTLSLVDIQDSQGAFPRHFNFDVTGQYVVVGNHASDSLVAFRILETGRVCLTKLSIVKIKIDFYYLNTEKKGRK